MHAHDTSGHARPPQDQPTRSDPAPSPAHAAGAGDGGARAGSERRGPGSAGYGSVLDRRSGVDRRAMNAALSGDYSGLERRRGAGRRLSDALRNAEEGSFTREQFLFVKAVDAFKQGNGVSFPTWTDVLEVIRLLGYRKTMPSEINLPACEDWREAGDAPSNVRPRGFERRLDGTVGERERRKFAA